MQNPGEIDPTKLELELALTIKLKRLFPDLPEEILGKLVPHLDVMNSENFGSMVPWNRHKRRRLQRARNVVLHVFSGDNPQFWERNLSTSTTEVLCVDLYGGGIKANLLDKNVCAFLLTVAASGQLRILMGGPPCRTVSALTSQDDGGPGELRSEEWPYGLPDLSMADAETVQNDSVLFFRYLSLYVVAEEVRLPQDPKTEFILEQPRDPEEYRSQENLQQRKYMSMFRTAEWKNFQATYQFYKVVFDQGPMGHERRKPTTLYTSMEMLMQLHGIHGDPAKPPENLRGRPLQERVEASKKWAAWAPGLKQALMVAIRQRLQVMDLEWTARHPQGAVTQKGQHDSLPALNTGPETTIDSQISLQSLGPDTVLPHESTAEVQASNAPTSSHESVPLQHQRQVKALGAVALEQWRRHDLNDHMPARRDCAQCVRAQARSKPHKKIIHRDPYALSVDLSGKLTPGDDQQAKGCRYLLVGCYTYPVSRDGRSLLPIPGHPH
eukprot:s777_g59.t1